MTAIEEAIAGLDGDDLSDAMEDAIEDAIEEAVEEAFEAMTGEDGDATDLLAGLEDDMPVSHADGESWYNTLLWLAIVILVLLVAVVGIVVMLMMGFSKMGKGMGGNTAGAPGNKYLANNNYGGNQI